MALVNIMAHYNWRLVTLISVIGSSWLANGDVSVIWTIWLANGDISKCKSGKGTLWLAKGDISTCKGDIMAGEW